ncbi:hypothetical protein ACLB2K_011524 [Fragaria x ananassa]
MVADSLAKCSITHDLGLISFNSPPVHAVQAYLDGVVRARRTGVEDLDLLVEHVDKTNFKRTCLDLISLARLVPGPDDMLVLDIAFMINLKFEEYPNALLIALFLDNKEFVKQVFTSCDDLLRKKQFCHILARHGSNFELNDEMVSEDEEREAMQDIINNAKLSEVAVKFKGVEAEMNFDMEDYKDYDMEY